MRKLNPDINLQAEAESLLNNPQLGFCAEITFPIQHVTAKGIEYQLQLKITTKTEYTDNPKDKHDGC